MNGTDPQRAKADPSRSGRLTASEDGTNPQRATSPKAAQQVSSVLSANALEPSAGAGDLGRNAATIQAMANCTARMRYSAAQGRRAGPRERANTLYGPPKTKIGSIANDLGPPSALQDVPAGP